LAEKRVVTWAEWTSERGRLGAKALKRKRLRSEYMSLMGRISGLAREERRLIRRIPYADIIERVIIGTRLRTIDSERPRLLTQMRHIRTTELPILEEDIARERREFALKIVPPPPPPPLKLHRIKIRLYTFERLPTPEGSFQTFWDIDAVIDPETGLVDWDWHLTKDEIQICKYHMIGYFKGLAKWRSPEQLGLAYFDEPAGIAYETERAKYKYSKNVPTEFIAKAEALTVGELIIGESSVEPKPNPEPTPENMGVFVERFMIIDADGVIKWDEIRNKWAWHPTRNQVVKVKVELKMKLTPEEEKIRKEMKEKGEIE